MSMLVAIQVTAIATAALAALALVTAITASGTLWQQSKQVRILVTERRQAQASAVFMGEDRPTSLGSSAGSGAGGFPIKATVTNASDRPIYDLYFIWHLGTKILYTDRNGRKLMPGEKVEAERDTPRGLSRDARRAFGANVIFRDAAGVRWLRNPDGYLREITADEAEGLLSKGVRLRSSDVAR